MSSPIPTHTPNSFRLVGDVAYIALTDRQERTVAEAIIDREDLARVLRFARWHLHPSGYAICTPNRHNGKRRVLLHRFVMDAPVGRVVDHVLGQRLDCRKAVLRLGTQADNLQNQDPRPRGRSGYRNVHWQANAGKWQVKIVVRGRTHSFGLYDDPAVAGAVALVARRSLHPFCRENSAAHAQRTPGAA